MGESFFADLEAAPRPVVAPADPVAKSLARRNRRGGEHAEADETFAA